MIEVSDVILKMRSRLNDKDPKKYRWTDEELIDCINSSLIEIESEINDTIETKCIKTTAGQNRYKLPKDITEDLNIRFENKKIIKKSFLWHLDNMDENKNYTYYYIDKKSIHIISPFEIEDNQKIEIVYSYMQQIDDENETIELNIILRDAIVFYSLFLAFQVPTSEKNEKKEKKYFGLYNIQIDKKIPILYKQRHTKNLRSKCKRV